MLPEGRTRKACEVMVDKEKQKVKKAREGGDGEEGTGEGEGKAKTGTKVGAFLLTSLAVLQAFG